MSAEQLVAAAAQATGPIVDGDLAGWSEQVRRAASSAVVIAADMERLLLALADPALKMHVRKVTGVSQEKGRFLIAYTPPIEVTFKGQTASYTDFRTGWVEEPHARQIARTARESVGQQCIFFQLNEINDGDSEAPAAGYRRLVHLEPVPSGVTKPRPGTAEPQPEPVKPAYLATENPAPTPQPEQFRTPEPEDESPSLDVLPPLGPPHPAFTRDGTIVGTLSKAQREDREFGLLDATVAAYRVWWNTLNCEAQQTLRRANEAAGRPVPMVQDPETVGHLKDIAQYARRLTQAAEREPVPA